MDLHDLTAHELRDLLGRGELTAVELAEAVLARIEQLEPQIKGYITVTSDLALSQAEAVDARRRAGDGKALGPLAGIPVAVKDNICLSGVRTTAASKMLHNFIAPYDATVGRRLQAAGAGILGKTNLDEFAMGSSTESSYFGPTHNPWDLSRVPGGSSGGSAAVVAAGEAVMALGTDTGGSIRQPAAFCGVVGLKPTYGLVSRYGAIAYASSLDQIGPITKDVRDCALLLQSIAGHDPLDSTSVPNPVPDYEASLGQEIKGLRIGLPKEQFGPHIAAEVREAVRRAARTLEALGAVVEEVSLPHTEYAVGAYYVISTAEASSNLGRFDGVRFGLRVGASDVRQMYDETRAQGFGAEVKRRILLGTYVLSKNQYDSHYQQARRVQTLVRRDFERAFATCDVLLMPTAPTVAFKLGEKQANPLEMHAADACTIPVNLAGLPGISLPCGFGQGGLPVGMHLVGRPFAESTLLQVAYAFEAAAGLAPLKPRIEVTPHA